MSSTLSDHMPQCLKIGCLKIAHIMLLQPWLNVTISLNIWDRHNRDIEQNVQILQTVFSTLYIQCKMLKIWRQYSFICVVLCNLETCCNQPFSSAKCLHNASINTLKDTKFRKYGHLNIQSIFAGPVKCSCILLYYCYILLCIGKILLDYS